MRQKLMLFVKLLSILALCLGLGSVFLAYSKVTPEIKKLSESDSTIEASITKAETFNKELSEVFPNDSSPKNINDEVSTVLETAKASAFKYGVTVKGLTPVLEGSKASFTPEPLMGEIETVKATVSGDFIDYLQFLGYIQELKKHAVSVTRLKVNNTQFEISVRVYGVKV